MTLLGVDAPAFGFKSTSAYTNKLNQEVAERMRRIDGFNTEIQASMQPEIQNTASTTAKTDIVAKTLGYVPVVGTVIGIKRINRLHIEHELQSKPFHTARGLIELFSIGAILIPVDALATLSFRIRM